MTITFAPKVQVPDKRAMFEPTRGEHEEGTRPVNPSSAVEGRFFESHTAADSSGYAMQSKPNIAPSKWMPEGHPLVAPFFFFPTIASGGVRSSRSRHVKS